MRIGQNPNKDKNLDKSYYIHQIVIPVYIPNHDGYFKDSLKVFNLCLESLFNSIHDKTFITVVNNGSSKQVKFFLDDLYEKNKIHELIHTDNIGKINAILKGLVGNSIELITISDADVLFLPNWQNETTRVFNQVPKAGVVGIVPQFKMYEYYCGNVIFDNLFNKKLKFLPVKNPVALERFYESIGWDKTYNQDYLKYNLGLEINNELSVLVGSGHFVATYKKDVFDTLLSFFNYKLGGSSESYLDKAPLIKDYWRLTTQDNYAFHMGNIYEDWMGLTNLNKNNNEVFASKFHLNTCISNSMYLVKNRLFVKLIISNRFINKAFLKWKKLPESMLKSY